MKINFHYNDIDIDYQANNMKENINDIFQKCRNDIDINSQAAFRKK